MDLVHFTPLTPLRPRLKMFTIKINLTLNPPTVIVSEDVPAIPTIPPQAPSSSCISPVQLIRSTLSTSGSKYPSRSSSDVANFSPPSLPQPNAISSFFRPMILPSTHSLGSSTLPQIPLLPTGFASSSEPPLICLAQRDDLDRKS